MCQIFLQQEKMDVYYQAKLDLNLPEGLSTEAAGHRESDCRKWVRAFFPGCLQREGGCMCGEKGCLGEALLEWACCWRHQRAQSQGHPLNKLLPGSALKQKQAPGLHPKAERLPFLSPQQPT